MTVSRETFSFSSFLGHYSALVLPDDNAFPVTFSGPLSYLAVSAWALTQKSDHILCVCESKTVAEALYRQCYNLDARAVFFFPEQSRENIDVAGFNLEYERFQAEAYNAVVRGSRWLLITTPAGLETAVKNPENTPRESFRLTVGSQITKEGLMKTLVSWGFEPCDKVIYPKTFASRGGILDIFLLYSSLPVRLEFFGDTIESLRTFNPLSQRQVHELDQLEILPPPTGETPDDNTIPLKRLLSSAENWVCETRASSRYFLQKSGVSRGPRLDAQEPTAFTDASYSSVFAFSDNPHLLNRSQNPLLENSAHVNANLSSHFEIPTLGLLCVSVPVLFRQPAPDNYRWTADEFSYSPQETVSAIDDIGWGDYLVHRDYGIGRYRGLQTVRQNNIEAECITIEYADGANVYVPIDKFNKVHKLTLSSGREPALSRLGTKSWQTLKSRVKRSTQVVVQDLLNMYANRNRPRGFCYQPNDELYETVAGSFSFEETPDQAQAIRDVINDMERDRPMDRLICGDVGFGKTEVAIRATIKAVASGKKVLLLTPTTILADQHYISFSSRLEPVGVAVDLLSRFRKKQEQLTVLEHMLRGTVDVIIGTHRLLSEDVHFPGLGLLIVDEEHRFGVKHKEKLKRLKETVDVLTLTATPIPRTLQQSLVGIRDISKILTPPRSRKPIYTFIKYHDWDIIVRVLNAERERGGQSYFLHNSVETLPFVYNELTKRIPRATIAIAHGQMKSRDLEKVILAFFRGEVDILLCTTIIESGLDVSNANTIIIDGAHRFGLAQLYQIRGRVGRSHRQAYCYLLIPHKLSLGDDAFKRLKAIEQYTTLGSGLDIAMKDLEIRGAGNLFGYKQSGNIAAVGFDLYCQILKEAVDESTGETKDTPPPVRIVSTRPALLDTNYMPQVADRIFFYKRLSETTQESEVIEIQAEIRDRFGPLPPAAQHLLDISRLRTGCHNTSIIQMDLSRDTVTIVLSGFKPFPSVLEMINAINGSLQASGFPYTLTPENKTETIRVAVRAGNPDAVLNVAQTFKELFTHHQP